MRRCRRVGTGVSDHERAVLHDKLMAISVKHEKGRSPPSCFRVTGLPKETPDFWVKDPFSSIVLQARARTGLAASPPDPLAMQLLRAGGACTRMHAGSWNAWPSCGSAHGFGGPQGEQEGFLFAELA